MKKRWLFLPLALGAVAALWQKIELNRFRVTTYHVAEPRVHGKVRMAVVADLHEKQFGKDNWRLLDAIVRLQPDVILIPGDLITASKDGSYPSLYPFDEELSFVEGLTEIAPVLYSPGNHERKIKDGNAASQRVYALYRKDLEALGVHYLENESVTMEFRGNAITFTGADISRYYYKKFCRTPMKDFYLKKRLPQPDRENPQVLLAHNPTYFLQYASWGADVTISGHTHGGLVRIPGIGSLISPQFELFPKYDAGRFGCHGKTMLVSKGLGTHTFHIRVFDRAEVLMVELRGY